MPRVLGKLLRIREGEGAKVLQFATMAALMEAGVAVGVSAADSLFLTHVGADKLPVIYLITPLMMLLYIPVFSYLMGRYGIDRLVNLTLAALFLGGVVFGLALTSRFMLPDVLWKNNLIYYLVKLYAVLWSVGLYTLLWSFIDAYFDILDAKRLFSSLSGGSAFGAMLGGALVTLSIRFMDVAHLLTLWAVLALATFPVVMRLRRRWSKIPSDDGETGDAKASLGAQTRLIVEAVRHSRYVHLLFLVFVTMLLLTTVCEYQCMKVFEEGRDEVQVAALFGRFYIWVNLFNLLVNFLLFNRLVILIGVRNTAMIQPIIYTLAFSFFVLRYGFGAAAFGFFAYQGFLTSIEFNNQNFLFNALPQRGKASIRTFIEGIGEPLATAVAGFFLLLSAPRLSPESISLVGLSGSAVLFCLVLGLRSAYVRAMLINLKTRWLDFSRPPLWRTLRADPRERGILERAARSGVRSRALPAIAMIRETDHETALDALLSFLDQASEEDQRAAAPQLAALLKKEDSEIFRRVLLWLKQTRARLSPSILTELGRYDLLSPEEVDSLARADSPDARAAAAVALWNSWKPEDNLRGMRLIHDLMQGPGDERLAAIGTIGKSEHPRYAHFLARYLGDPSSRIRRQALAAMSDLIDEESDRLLSEFLLVIRQGDHAERLIGLEVLSKIRNAHCTRPLVLMSHLLTPFERRRARSVLIEIGLESIPSLTSVLEDPRCPIVGKSMAARTLARLAFAQWESLAPNMIDREIRNAYDLLCARRVLAQHMSDSPPLEVLARFFKDKHAATVNFILEMLTISGRLPDFEMMASSLQSSNPKSRANAIETIEQGCTRRVFALLLPLIDARPWGEAAEFYCKTFDVELPSFWDMLLSTCDAPRPLGAAAAMQALLSRETAEDGLPPAVREVLYEQIHRRLLEPWLHTVADTVFSVLARRHMPDSPEAARRNIVEKVHALWSTEFFRHAEVDSVEMIARRAIEQCLPEGHRIRFEGEPCRSIYVVIDGEMRVRTPDGERTVGRGSVLGTDALLGPRDRHQEAVSDGVVVLEVSTASLLAVAETHPDFAVGLLARKLEASREVVAS